MIGMSAKEKILRDLRQGVLKLDREATERAAKEAVKERLDPLEATSVLTSTIREIGEKFERMELFLPELMMAAEAMSMGISVLKPELERLKERAPRLGTFVIGTVRGDIHDIGKTIVSTMLTAAGFEVIDIGKDVTSSAFAEAVRRYNPDIVGASATMTTTMEMERDLIEYFGALGLREKVKMMVGGAVVTKEIAEEMGADGYGRDAVEAAEVAKKLVAGGA